ncbi:MAG: ABC transporter substrate-binding protein [Rhodospirillales bacterium]|nr:ABC transporter substrate-binding protein [Rhodospirillales bacterium]
MILFFRQLVLAALIFAATPFAAGAYVETPFFNELVVQGRLPAVDARLPETPSVVALNGPGLQPGIHGGQLRILMGGSKDTRMMIVYGYARLVGYDHDFNLTPDILEDVEIKEGRIFTLKIRKGHRWSDGNPFTSEDFRYYWEDVVMNKEMSPTGAPRLMMIDGDVPTFEVIDKYTVRYSWPKPNPFFLPLLAGASPLFIYRPSHYLKQFHAQYVNKEELDKKVKANRQRNWVSLQLRMGRQYKNTNPDLPTLQPWVLQTKPPSDRFVFTRNPYYHRVDEKGLQLPYLDRVVMTIASSKLIPAKTGTGESDIQARNIQFNNYTFLKQGEKRNNFKVRLWQSAKGAQMAIYPNLNTTDPVWRKLFRTTEFRRALSIAIDRNEINQVIYFGLAEGGNNTILRNSKLFRQEYADKWAKFDIKKANQILDGLGLTKWDSRKIRILPDGRPMEITVETAGEDSEQADVLELIRDSWARIGIKLHTKLLQREVFRNRVFAGSTLISVWFGLENGVPAPETSPHELAPTSQNQLQWPKWGQFFETKGMSGEKIGIKEARELMDLNNQWINSSDRQEKTAIWHKMLAIHADQVFTIGLIRGVPQPVVVNNNLRNVPEKGIYNWDPGAHLGVHRPDTFWFENK